MNARVKRLTRGSKMTAKQGALDSFPNTGAHVGCYVGVGATPAEIDGGRTVRVAELCLACWRPV